MHPNLFWYISKQDLDNKFDSIKNTIDTPLTPLQFYFKLQPVISDIREGHLSLRIPSKRITKREIKALENKKGMFSRFDYYIQEDRLFIIGNKDSIENIKPGTEILTIDRTPVSYYINRYKKLISTDGFNTTFKPYFLKDLFFSYYVAEKGYENQASIETVYKGKKKTYQLMRESKSETDLKKEKEDKKKNGREKDQ